jgi:polar amino acid transport system permease protein
MPGWDWEAFGRYLASGYLLEGAWTTVWLSVVTMTLGLTLGLVAAVMHLSRNRALQAVAKFYLWIMRGTPLLVQLINHLHGTPPGGDPAQRGPVSAGRAQPERGRVPVGDHPGRDPLGAAPAIRRRAALGMPYPTLMRVVVLPQAARVMIPPLGNNFNGLLKTTSITSVISMEELLRRGQMLIQVEFRVLEIFVVAALYYLAMISALEPPAGEAGGALWPHGSGHPGRAGSAAGRRGGRSRSEPSQAGPALIRPRHGVVRTGRGADHPPRGCA